MDREAIFQDLNIDVITGVQVLDMLDVTTDELVIPQRFSRLKSVINFLKQFPEDTQRLLINKSVRSKAVDKLNHFFEYTVLLKQKGEYEEMLKNIENEKSVILETDEKFKEVEDRFNDVSGKLNDLKEELFIYEK